MKIHHGMQSVDGGSHVEGVMYPFGVRAKSGIWFGQSTDFGLNVFPSKPLLHLHLLDGKLQKHGVFVQDAFEKTAQGLFVRSSIDEFVRALMAADDIGFTGGSMPHLVKIDDNGFVRQWVMVEGSVGPTDMLDNQPGTTKAYIQFFPGVDLPDCSIVRSEFVMPGTNEVLPVEPGGSTEVVAPVIEAVLPDRREVVQQVPDPFAMPDNVRALQAEVAAMNAALIDMQARVDAVENAPNRRLSEVVEPVDPPAPSHWNDHVASQYDIQSLEGMLFDDAMRRAQAHADPMSPYRQTDEFWRATIDKMRAAHDEDMIDDNQAILQHITEDGIEVYDKPYRQISADAYSAVHDKVPYLQADEAMRTGFTNFGAEIIPTLFSSVMYHHFRASALVWSNLTTFTPPSYPNYSWPILTAGPTTRRAKEIEDDSQQNPANSPIPSSKVGTDNVDFQALGAIAARTVLSEQLIWASAAPLREAMMREFMLEMGAKIDWVLMNGDETAVGISHGVTTEGTVWDKAQLMDGLRSIARANSDDVAHATIAITSTGVIRALMGTRRRFGRDIRNLIGFIGPEVSDKFSALTEYQNINEVGAGLSTLLNGEVGRVNGIPHVVTEALELGDASGDYAGVETSEPHATGTVGIFGFVHKPTIKVAEFQALRFNVEYVIHARSFQFTASWEGDIQSMEAGGVAIGFNTTI